MATRKSSTKRTTKAAPRALAGSVSARARVIWISLVASMTLVGGVLYALDPSAKNSEVQGLMAKASAMPTLDLKAAHGKWTRIVLVDTGSPYGDSPTLHEQGQKLGEPAGVGFHFVIGNGRGLDDGRPYECPFWISQQAASPVYAPGQTDGQTIVVALVGNTRRDRVTEGQAERTRILVADLMRQFKIPFDRVDLSRLGPGFGAAAFREALGG